MLKGLEKGFTTKPQSTQRFTKKAKYQAGFPWCFSRVFLAGQLGSPLFHVDCRLGTH
jgi:hypothetical protein